MQRLTRIDQDAGDVATCPQVAAAPCIDVRLQSGVDRADFARSLQASPHWPADITLAEPGDAAARISSLSRAYRVNLTVLALIALFTIEQLVNGWQHGFEGPEDQDNIPAVEFAE